MDNSIIITTVSLLLVLVITGMIAFMVSGGKAKQKQRMMSVIRGGAVEEKSGKKDKDTRRDHLAKKLKQKGEGEEQKDDTKKATLALSLVHAGLSISTAQFWLFSFIFAAVATLAMFLFGKEPFVIIATAVIALLGVPRFILKKMIRSRQKKFLADFADALEAMMRLLKAGMPISESIKMVAREFGGPVGEEMGRIFDQQKIGVSLPEAVLECSRRMPLPEVQMFATAIAIQAQTGSSLSEILENLAKVIRSRFRLKRKVVALSSEAKSSAIIIGILPIFVAVAMYFINPDYIGLLFTDNTGKWLLGFAIFWMTCGILVMKQMINFKV